MKAASNWKNMASLYISWLLISAIAFSFPSIIAIFVFRLPEAIFFLVLYICVSVWVVGFGFFQARLLHQKLVGTIFWVFVVTCYVAIFASPLKINESSSSIPAFIAGGVVGVIQFIILRKNASETIWWIPASTLAWGISYIIGLRIFSIYGVALYIFAIGIVNGIVTGIPYTISFSKLKLQIMERIALVTISAFLLTTIWLSVNAGLNRADSTFAFLYNPRNLQFSPDSRILAIAYPNGLEFRNADGWEVTGSIAFKSEDHYINGISFSPDGQTIAIALCCDDNVIELWDATNFQYIDTLRGHVDDVYTVAFSPDGRLVVSGGKGTEWAQIIIWDFASKRALQYIPFPGDRTVQGVTFSPDGRTLAVSLQEFGPGDARIIFLDLISGEVTRENDGFYDPFFEASFSKDWNYLAGAAKNTIKIVDISNGSEIRRLSMDSEYFTVSLVNNVLIEDSAKNMIRVWDVENGVIIAKLFPAPDFSITTVSPDGKWIVSAYRGDIKSDCRSNCTVRVWNLKKYSP